MDGLPIDFWDGRAAGAGWQGGSGGKTRGWAPFSFLSPLSCAETFPKRVGVI